MIMTRMAQYFRSCNAEWDRRVVPMFVQIAISIISVLLLSSPAAAVECKSELTGLTVYFYSKGNEWSKTWKADGVHKRKTDYNSNRKEGVRTNISEGLIDKRSESLPQMLLQPDKQFNFPFDISQNGKLLIAAIHEKK